MAAAGFLEGTDLRTVTSSEGALSGALRSPHPRRLITLTGLLAFVLAAAAFSAAVVVNTAPSPGVAGGAPGLDSGREKLPAGLESAVERARYAIVPDPRGGAARAYVAENPSQSFAARFTDAGVTLGHEGRKSAWQLRLRLTGVGYGERLERPAAPAFSADQNRVELRRGPLIEWYENRPRGLEQGFTLSSPLARDAQGPLVLRMSVGGDLRPRADASGDPISFVDGSGQPVLIYSGLHARDAGGRNVPARMSAGGGELSLAIDDAEAAYPLTIDPFVTQAKLELPPGAAADDNLGSVAVSGNTALVGAPAESTRVGAVYVFVRSGTTWSLQRKLTAPDGRAFDGFGYSVALSGDANTALIGARLDDTPGGVDAGSAYVFVRSGTSWTFQQKLPPGDGAADDLFGASVRLSGDTAVVGAPGDDTPGGGGVNAGSAYVFVRSGTSWSLQRKLTASDSAAGDRFGTSVAVSGETALVGAPDDDTLAGTDAGTAHVFVRSGTTWSLQRKLDLTARNGESYDRFGASVRLSGDTALIGAPEVLGSVNPDTGSAHVFVRSGTSWSYQQELSPSGSGSTRNFGTSLALGVDTAVVGAPADYNASGKYAGSAYVFVRSGTTWSLQQKLGSSDGAPGDRFGESVALSGDTALIGAPFDDTVAGANAGSAHVFVRSGTSWSFQRKFVLTEGAGHDDELGKSVALSGDTALVSAPGDDTVAGVGSAGVFVRSGTTWSFQQKIPAGGPVALSGDTALVGSAVYVRSGTTWSLQQHLASGSDVYENFGASVALSGDTALIGAPGDASTGTDAGSAYVFVRSGTTWSMQQKLTASDGASGDFLGTSVALGGDGNTALVGAPFDDTPGGVDVGSAYVFVRSGTTWSFQRKLSAGVDGDRFGSSVALSGDTALIGAPVDNTAAGPDAGSANVFVRSGTSWSFQQRVMASDAAPSDQFGYSVALIGDLALVGAPFDDTAAGEDAGSAHVFIRSGTSWSFQQQLSATGAVRPRLGASVALTSNTALVGAPGDDTTGGPNAGSARVFVGP